MISRKEKLLDALLETCGCKIAYDIFGNADIITAESNPKGAGYLTEIYIQGSADKHKMISDFLNQCSRKTHICLLGMQHITIPWIYFETLDELEIKLVLAGRLNQQVSD